MDENSYTENTVKPQRAYSIAEILLAWLFFAAGYAFWRIFPVFANPLGGFIFVIILFGTTIIILKRKAVQFHAIPLAAAASAILVSLALIFSSNGTLHFFSFVYAAAVYCYFISASCGSSTARGFTDFILIDFIKALFVLPFYSFEEIFKALFSGKAKGSGKMIMKVLVGIGAALIPTAIVLSLLSYDKDFSKLIDSIFSFDFSDIMSHIISIIFGIPVGMYLFGLYVSAADKKCVNILTADDCKTASAKIKRVPVVTALAAAIPLLFVYVIFFISQWKYYISAFAGNLPKNSTYAEYARGGFFELCIVSVINLIVIVAVMLLMRRQNDRPSPLLKILSVLYSVFTLILISTALAKMKMYINCYGLTQKRVYATWFMIVLTVVFIIIIVRQFVSRLNAAAASLLAAVILFATLSVSNVDALIAKYNVNCYIDGTLKTVDVYAIDELGDAGVPELVRLYEALNVRIEEGSGMMEDYELQNKLTEILTSKKAEYRRDERSFFSVTVPYMRAKKALENAAFNK